MTGKTGEGYGASLKMTVVDGYKEMSTYGKLDSVFHLSCLHSHPPH